MHVNLLKVNKLRPLKHYIDITRSTPTTISNTKKYVFMQELHGNQALKLSVFI